MIIKKDLRLSNCFQTKKGNGYMVSFLDENDDKLSLYFDNDNAKKFLNAKQYDKFTLDLQFIKDNQTSMYKVRAV